MRASMNDNNDTLPILVTPHPALRTKARPVGPADADAVRALTEMGRVARRGIIVNDLVRTWPGYLGAWLLGMCTTTNRLTRHDAPLSVLRAWTADELHTMAADAGLTDVTVREHAFCRQALVSIAQPAVGRESAR